jgi:16S rRNA (cytosine967-C5)-methyltransferase
LAQLQKSLLETAAKYVKPGGILVYCTCTITKEENTDNIKYFLETHSNFTLLNERQILPSPTSDAFFVAALTKT